MIPVVGSTDLPLERIRRGKVRDVYAIDADRLMRCRMLLESVDLD